MAPREHHTDKEKKADRKYFNSWVGSRPKERHQVNTQMTPNEAARANNYYVVKTNLESIRKSDIPHGVINVEDGGRVIVDNKFD